MASHSTAPCGAVAKSSTARFHTRDDLLKNNLINSKQHEALLEVTRNLKRNYKYVSYKELIESTLLTDTLVKVGFTKPTMIQNDLKRSLDAVLLWQNRLIPFAKYVIHVVTGNRQEMTKIVKGEYMSKC